MWNRSCQRRLRGKDEGAAGARVLPSASIPTAAALLAAESLAGRVAALLIILLRLYRLTLSPFLGHAAGFIRRALPTPSKRSADTAHFAERDERYSVSEGVILGAKAALTQCDR